MSDSTVSLSQVFVYSRMTRAVFLNNWWEKLKPEPRCFKYVLHLTKYIQFGLRHNNVTSTLTVAVCCVKSVVCRRLKLVYTHAHHSDIMWRNCCRGLWGRIMRKTPWLQTLKSDWNVTKYPGIFDTLHLTHSKLCHLSHSYTSPGFSSLQMWDESQRDKVDDRTVTVNQEFDQVFSGCGA